MLTPPQTFFADDTLHIALWHNLAIIDCGGDMKLVHMRKIGDAYRTLAQTYPDGVLGLALVRPQTPVASAEARAESQRFMRELGGTLQHTAMVIEARGVLAQMLVSVVRGINVLARHARISVASDVAEAIRNVSPLLQPIGAAGRDGRELIAAITSVRSALSARLPDDNLRFSPPS